MNRRDRELGMDREITRRDFLSGVNIAVTGSLLSTPLAQAFAALEDSAGDVSAQMMPGYYPPVRDGLRGSEGRLSAIKPPGFGPCSNCLR